MRLIVALSAACAVLASVAAEPEVTVARDGDGVTATARYPGGCVASLSHSPASRALRYRNECEPVLAANLRALAALKIALFGNAGLPEQVTRLDAGRLVMTWPEMALRLALVGVVERARRHARVRRERPALALVEGLGPAAQHR